MAGNAFPFFHVFGALEGCKVYKMSQKYEVCSPEKCRTVVTVFQKYGSLQSLSKAEQRPPRIFPFDIQAYDNFCGSLLLRMYTGSFIIPLFLGQQCTVDIDECVSKPCQNHGLCHNTQGSYMCECPPGFSGMDCEEDINDCLASEYDDNSSASYGRERHQSKRAQKGQLPQS